MSVKFLVKESMFNNSYELEIGENKFLVFEHEQTLEVKEMKNNCYFYYCEMTKYLNDDDGINWELVSSKISEMSKEIE